MKIYHLSHTDLDGYACQFIVNFYFKNVKFYNSNYGKEINENFNSIIGDIEKDENFGKAIILITDLNLNLNQCEEFEKICKEKNTKIFLLDHHQSGEECAQKYSWYLLDSKRCATKIVYDFFSKICVPILNTPYQKNAKNKSLFALRKCLKLLLLSHNTQIRLNLFLLKL